MRALKTGRSARSGRFQLQSCAPSPHIKPKKGCQGSLGSGDSPAIALIEGNGVAWWSGNAAQSIATGNETNARNFSLNPVFTP
jgi:hypothetical protein